MACVALASLISTIQLEFLQRSPRVPLLHQPSIQSFFESICSLQAFLQESSGGGAAIKDLEIQIRDFALKAEDDIEIQLSNFVLVKGREDQEKASEQLHLALQEAAENASELLNISNNAAGDDDNETQLPIHRRKHAFESEHDKSNGSSPCSPKPVSSYSKSNRVNIIYELWSLATLTIISIVGMVGIGKTTLAKSVYLDPEVEERFDVRGWITMPQKYNKNQLLRLLLLSLSPAAEKKIEKGSFAPEEEVEVQLIIHKTEDEPPTYPLSELTIASIALGDESQIGFGAPTTEFPCRISEIPQLRHLELTDVYIADPPSMVEGKLKTLSLVVPCHCCKKVYYSFPNIKKLKLFYKQESEPTHVDGSSSNSIFLDKLRLLEQLESLTISVPVGCTATFPQFSGFPLGLMKLKLSGTNLSWWNLRGFGMWNLRVFCIGDSLKVLKLENVLLGRVWEVNSDEFPNLRFLLLQDKELKQLKVDEKYALPRLEHLVLRFCYGLEEITFQRGRRNLKSIELFWCNPSAIACAKQIFEKRPDRGDNGIELKIDGDIYDERPKAMQRSPYIEET